MTVCSICSVLQKPDKGQLLCVRICVCVCVYVMCVCACVYVVRVCVCVSVVILCVCVCVCLCDTHTHVAVGEACATPGQTGRDWHVLETPPGARAHSSSTCHSARLVRSGIWRCSGPLPWKQEVLDKSDKGSGSVYV